MYAIHFHKVRSGSRCQLNRSLTHPRSPRLYDGLCHSKYFHCAWNAKQTSRPHLPHVPRRPESRNACVRLSKTWEDPEKPHKKNWKSGRLWEMTKQGVLNAFYIKSQVFNFIPQDLLQPNHFDTRQPAQQIASVFQFNTRNLLSFWIHLWKDKSAGLGRAVIKRYWKLLRLGIPYWPSWNISHWVRSLNANWGTNTYQVYPDILKSVMCAIFTSPGTRNGIAKIRKINIHPSSIILTQISNSRPWVAVSGLLKKQSNVLIAKEALSQHLF